MLDLTSLWAGPLATHVLAAAGARVIKVESRTRPDSVRESSPAFFDLLHAGKDSVQLDFNDARDRLRLCGLLAHADVIVTSARARAFAHLGLAPRDVLAAHPHLTWVAITAHGFDGADAQAIGFGDDAAAGGGLVGRLPDRRPVFLGDAIADPLTGLAAALAALDGLRTGGGRLHDVSLRATAAWVAAADACDPHEVTEAVAPPRARAPTAKAAAAGADTARVLREFSLH